ncbi:short-chain dehydrogenase/reductase family protein [Capsicum annuum]|nr:short-chain dehydrogenase/reductase family protein [Capsicum annuum]
MHGRNWVVNIPKGEPIPIFINLGTANIHILNSSMDSSDLTSLPEEGSEENQIFPSAFSSVPARPRIRTSSQKYAPSDWSDYFDREDDIQIPDSDDVFHVYMAGTEGPVIFCLHGGGYSGFGVTVKVMDLGVKCLLAENLRGRGIRADFGGYLEAFIIRMRKLGEDKDLGKILGGGFENVIKSSKIKEKARIVAMDLRGHGKTSTQNDVDLSIETLCSDVFSVLKTMYGDAPPAIVLVGHSMGGAVAVHVVAKKSLPSLAGLVVVDVVEGTALASLIHMQKILSNRMQHFSTPEKAVPNA